MGPEVSVSYSYTHIILNTVLRIKLSVNIKVLFRVNGK